MANWRARLKERKQRAEAEWDRLTGRDRKMTMRGWELESWAKRRGIPVENGQIKHPTEDRYLTYREYKHLRRKDRQEQYDAAWDAYHERNRQRVAWVLTKLHLYYPHYLKHPTEDREVTYGEWKIAQRAVILREKHRYNQMHYQHSWHYRLMVWLSHPEEHITPLDRLRMRRTGETREERLAHKAENLAARREVRKFWKLGPELVRFAAPRIKRFAKNARLPKRRVS